MFCYAKNKPKSFGVPSMNLERYFFILGVICPQNLTLKLGQTGTSLRAVYRSRDALQYCLLHVVVQKPGSFRGRSPFLYDVRLRSYGTSICPIFGFWPIFSIQNPGDQPTAQGLHRRMIPIFRVIVECPKRCLPVPKIFCDFW